MADDRPVPDVSYELSTREGEQGVVWRFKDSGVTLTTEAIAWRRAGRDRSRAYTDIRKIRIGRAFGGKHGDVYHCVIRFHSGAPPLAVHSTDGYGMADAERERIYARFVRDLHARLRAANVTGIRFAAGLTEGRYLVLSVATIALGIMCAIPIPFFFYRPSWHVLGVMAGAVGLMIPLLRSWDANRPRDYNPARLPADLVP